MAVRATYLDVDVAWVSHWHIAGGDADPNNLISEVWQTGGGSFDTLWRAAHTSDYHMGIVYGRAIWREGEGFVDDSPVESDLSGRNGTHSNTDAIAPALEQTATLYTGLTGRRHRGRIRFCSGGEADIAGDVWVNSSGKSSDLRKSALDLLMSLYGSSGSTDFTVGVFSKVDANEGATVLADVFQPVTSYRLREQLRWLRSRMS
jgi:hypothetical protein